jgi:hypothetical protein
VIGCLAILLGVQQGVLVLFRQFNLAEKLTNAQVAETEGELAFLVVSPIDVLSL